MTLSNLFNLPKFNLYTKFLPLADCFLPGLEGSGPARGRVYLFLIVPPGLFIKYAASH